MAITLDPTMSAMMNTGSVYNNAQLNAANRLSEQIEGASNDEDTLQACKDFEAYMLENLFKKMNESAKLLADDEEEDSSKAYLEAFEDNYYQDIAQKMMASGQGVGIAEQLYRSIMDQKLGISKDTTTEDQAVNQLARMTGATSEDIRKMTPQEQAEVAAVQAESAFANALTGN